MIKKYVMMISVLLVMLMFTSTSTASFVFSKGKIYEMLPENSAFKRILDKLSQIASNNDAGVLIDTDEDDGEDDDMMDTDDPLKEDVLLPKIWDLVGEKTPDDGNEPVDDSEETLNTIDPPDGDDDGVVWDNGTVDSDGDGGVASNEITIDEGEWTVKRERFVEIVMERNVQLGGMLQRVVERTFAPGTTESDGTAENDIVDVVVEGESVGTAENDIVGVVVEGESVGTPGEDIADVVVLTDDGQ